MVSYGKLSNARLLLLYGFVPFSVDDANDKPSAYENEESPSVELYAPLPSDITNVDAKRSILEAANLGDQASGSVPFVLRRNASELLPASLLGMLRVQRAETEDELARAPKVFC